jgi:Tol biopolymer transport system component
MERDVFVAFSPDGRHAAYVTADGDLEIADLGAQPGDNPVHVDAPGGFSPGLAWAPDGSQVVFTQLDASSELNGNYTTWIVNADGTNPRQISTGSSLVTMDDPWQPVPVR